MAINLTDSLNAATTKGKLGDAKQIYLNGDEKNLQQAFEESNDHFGTLDNRSTQMENAIQDISVTGGASTANAVSYNNSTSKLEAITAQGAIDELAAKTKAEKAEVTAELEKKFDKESILQESGDAEDKVMSQKAVTQSINEIKTDLEVETARAKAAEEANELAINTLKDKTSEIIKEVIETDDDYISIEDNNGNEVFHLDGNSLDAKNVKSNGKPVLTEHQDISNLATKEEVESKVEEAKVKDISSETTWEEEDYQAWDSNDYDGKGNGERYGKMTSKGMYAKAYFKMDGTPIDGGIGDISIDTVNGILIFGNFKYKLIPYED